MSNRTSILAAIAAAFVLVATPALAAPSSDPGQPPRPIAERHVPDEVLVGFAPGSAASDRAAARSVVNVSSSERLSPLATDAELWTLPPGRSVEEAIATLSKNPNIRYVEPNYILDTTAIPNDPDFTNGSLWGMYGDASTPSNAFGSQAAEAWAGGATGTAGTYVVVIDEGLQITHPDLTGNVWTNPYETADNGFDDDSNGYIDDVNGWDFVGNDNGVYDGTGDDHGTHVAGTIGAVGNNSTGVAGVNWDVTMISAKFLGASGGTTANAVKSVDYATDLKTRHGLNIVATSNSWGGGGYSLSLRDAIVRGGAKDILFIAAAGNSATNNDVSASYPSNYDCHTATSSFDCVVAVAAIDSAGRLASFSQYGATTVDLGAPGVSIRSTLPSNTYGNYSGTSMATPHVSGAAALCASMSAGLSGKQLRDALLSSTTATASLAGKTTTGGRLDMGKLADLCGTTDPPPTSTAPSVTSFTPTFGPAGTLVTISGADLTGATVAFNGTPAAVTSSTSGSVAAFVPSGATSGTISVTTSGGTATSVEKFTVTAPATVPTAPTSPRTVSVTRTSGTVAWSEPTSLGTLLRYEVRRGTGSWTPVDTATSYTFTGLRKNTSYNWSVRAINTVGTGAIASSTFRTAR